MDEPLWLGGRAVRAIHDDQALQHGGAAGIRDPSVLETALGRPRSKWAFDAAADLPAIAAAYAAGILETRPFAGSNARAALASMLAFLGINGHSCAAPEHEAAVEITRLAAGRTREDGFAAWLRPYVMRGE